MIRKESEEEMENRNRFGRGVAAGILGTVLVLAVLCGGVFGALRLSGWTGFGWPAQEEQNGETGDGYGVADAATREKLALLQEYIDKYFLYDVDRDKIADGIYKGLVYGLDDPYADYFTAEEYGKMKEKSSGEYYGIGVAVMQNTTTGVITITQVYSSGPAAEAGLQPEDILQAVNGETVTGVDLDEVVTLIRGYEGTSVKLTIYRPSSDSYLDFEVERRQVQEDTVSHEMLDGQIGYLKLTAFELVSPQQFADALADLKARGMKAFVLDLRNNGGGDLTSVVDIGNQILPEGTILTIEYNNDETEVYESDGKNAIDIPMVVLVNGNTASAAEVLSGAAKDYGIATLVGTQTFGKGIVQTLFPLNDGSAIKMTVANYYTPSGASIHGVGIEPDVIVEPDGSGEDNQLAKALEILKEQTED
jgi:carboxyl-terminal processing protease